MFVAYDDESGDDGCPQYSSPIFVLSALYLHHLDWQDIYGRIVTFRRRLKKDFDFPVKLEMHTKYFLPDKRPCSPYRISGGSILPGLISSILSVLKKRRRLTWTAGIMRIGKRRKKNAMHGCMHRVLSFSVSGTMMS